MIKKVALSLILLLSCSGAAWADQFLGLDLLPGSAKVTAGEGRLELTTSLSPQQVIDFHKSQLGEEKDVRFREWAGRHIVEDFGVKPWNKIIITAEGPNLTRVVITKDSWTWTFSMLALRLLGVFTVLLCLFLSTSLFTGLINRKVRRSPEVTS